MKYDTNLNLLWANWLEGPYTSNTLPTSDNGPALAEGPADGIFVVTKGESYVSSVSIGAMFRAYLLNANGALLNTAAWQIDQAKRGGIQDEPRAALYVPAEDKLYIAGRRFARVVIRGLTLDQPYAVDGGSSGSQNQEKSIHWLPDKNRVLYVGDLNDGIHNGPGIAEYSPDLQTRYQQYGYSLGRTQGFAMDQFGAVYLLTLITDGAQITKLSSSGAGYVPLWSRTFNWVVQSSATLENAISASIKLLPDGRIVATGRSSGGTSAERTMQEMYYTIAADGTKIISRTSLLWTGVRVESKGNDFLDLQRETGVFVASRFATGKTSLKLPSIGVGLLLGSTADNGNANKNMTGLTNYTEVPLIDVALPGRVVLPQVSRDLNPLIKWAEPAWTTSDLTATVQHVTVSTGPLQAPQ